MNSTALELQALEKQDHRSFFSKIENTFWDFAITGAGPAGAMLAYRLAASGRRILLVDQARFPRVKACGGCLSHLALRELRQAGLGDLPAELGAKPLTRLHLISGKHSARIPIPSGASLSREKMDWALIQAAEQKGVVFLPETKAVLKNTCADFAQIQLAHGEINSDIKAGILLVCDGLSGSTLNQWKELGPETATDSLIGISAAVANVHHAAFSVKPGGIYMVCDKSGYAGMVLREDGQIEIAAAVQRDYLKACASPRVCLENIFQAAGIPPVMDFSTAIWHGTATLLRARKKIGGHRFLVLGDAASFVEPFTGEGIYWAWLQARLLAELLTTHDFSWHAQLPAEWQKLFTRFLKPKQKICRQITSLLRFPWLCAFCVRILSHAPWLAAPFVRAIHGENHA